ncbi:MAG: KTSC domain-containing protein [Spirulinaceae cyanobacterium RM2_2_10]|nr:KTSC domain-containing protein [Spirulinaceae cyanobacterium RM2_2_10]
MTVFHCKNGSTLDWVKYDPMAEEMEVRAKNKLEYHFRDVPQDVYEGFKMTEGDDAYFYTHIRFKYPFNWQGPKNLEPAHG